MLKKVVNNMNNEFKGKRLLIYSGSDPMREIISGCHRLGITPVVTDYLPDSPAKKYADENYMVSTIDIDEIEKLCRDKKIDGIVTAFMDSMMFYCREACDRMGYFFYANKSQINIVANKAHFKNKCREFGVPIVPEPISTENEDAIDPEKLDYPIVIKPVDGCGSKGLYTCFNSKDFKSIYLKSKSQSRCKDILIEKYMQGNEVCIYYAFQDGEITLTAMCDRYTNREQTGYAPLPSAYIYPSKYLERYMKSVDRNMKAMFSSMGMKNGVAFVQAFADDKNFYIYEMGYRLCGAMEYRYLDYLYDENTLEMILRYSLTGKMADHRISERINPMFKKYCCKITPLLKKGVIAKIEGIDEIENMQSTIGLYRIYKEGDAIDDDSIGTLNQILCRIFITSDTLTELKNTINHINSTIKVFDKDGNNMLLACFDTNILNEGYREKL